MFSTKILGCRDPRYKHDEQQGFEYLWVQKMNDMKLDEIRWIIEKVKWILDEVTWILHEVSWSYMKSTYRK